MRLWVAIIFVVSLCAALPVQAGPWLREKGSGFTSVSVTATYMRDFGNSSYLEFGLRDDLTIGADVSIVTNRFGQQTGHGTIFMRRPLGSTDGPNRWAYELGVGTAWVGDLMLPHVKTGLSWGRGFALKDKNGWMAVDASVTWDVSYGLHLSKVDATLGMSFTETTTGMVQLYLAHLDQSFFATVAPSIVIKPRKAKFRIQIGSEIPVDDMANAALKVGIWREF